MSTSDHPQTDGQTERVNRSDAEMPRRWSSMLPIVEFAMNNAVHASIGYIPFYVNGLTHPRVPLSYHYVAQGLMGERWPISLLMSALLLFKNRLACSSQRD